MNLKGQKTIEDISRPPSPIFILRGHSSEVHSLHFSTLPPTAFDLFLYNTLISGDADGFVIVWSLVNYRPKAIWKAHEAPVVTLQTWNEDIITHGRDNKIYIWRILQPENMTTIFPAEQLKEERGEHESETWRKPWMVCSLDVNSLNFCSFSSTLYNTHQSQEGDQLLVATPALVSSDAIDIWCLPLCTRFLTKISPPEKSGSVMSLQLARDVLIAGYENGGCAVYRLDVDRGIWSCLYYEKKHRDSILSVVFSIDCSYFWSVGVDSLLIRHSSRSIFDSEIQDQGDKEDNKASRAISDKTFDTKHSGQASLCLRSDGRILVSAGWDGCARVYATKTCKPLAVLRWHKSGLLVVAIALHDCDKQTLIASAGKDGRIALWNVF